MLPDILFKELVGVAFSHACEFCNSFACEEMKIKKEINWGSSELEPMWEKNKISSISSVGPHNSPIGYRLHKRPLQFNRSGKQWNYITLRNELRTSCYYECSAQYKGPLCNRCTLTGWEDLIVIVMITKSGLITQRELHGFISVFFSFDTRGPLWHTTFWVVIV